MRIGLLSLLIAAAASAALAQPAPTPDAPTPNAPAATPPDTSAASAAPRPARSRDLIGDLINPNAPPPRDEDEPDVAGQPRTAPEPEPDLLPGGPAPKIYTPEPHPQLDRPVNIDELGKTPDGPAAIRDLAYDARIRASFASAESFQGPLDGGWTLSAGREDLYALQLVDRRDRLEGVWRDIRRKGALDASGLVDDMQRQGGELTLRFAPSPGAPMTVATLRDSGNGMWSGELVEGAGHRSVVLKRSGL
jgi:hypothetical protein